MTLPTASPIHRADDNNLFFFLAIYLFCFLIGLFQGFWFLKYHIYWTTAESQSQISCRCPELGCSCGWAGHQGKECKKALESCTPLCSRCQLPPPPAHQAQHCACSPWAELQYHALLPAAGQAAWAAAAVSPC